MGTCFLLCSHPRPCIGTCPTGVCPPEGCLPGHFLAAAQINKKPFRTDCSGPLCAVVTSAFPPAGLKVLQANTPLRPASSNQRRVFRTIAVACLKVDNFTQLKLYCELKVYQFSGKLQLIMLLSL